MDVDEFSHFSPFQVLWSSESRRHIGTVKTLQLHAVFVSDPGWTRNEHRAERDPGMQSCKGKRDGFLGIEIFTHKKLHDVNSALLALQVRDGPLCRPIL